MADIRLSGCRRQDASEILPLSGADLEMGCRAEAGRRPISAETEAGDRIQKKFQEQI
jgi:hypothetical protein